MLLAFLYIHHENRAILVPPTATGLFIYHQGREGSQAQFALHPVIRAGRLMTTEMLQWAYRVHGTMSSHFKTLLHIFSWAYSFLTWIY
jgi:hypothetical protein